LTFFHFSRKLRLKLIQKIDPRSSPIGRISRECVTHTVSSSETLAGIALKYDLTIEDIRRYNSLWQNDNVWPGANPPTPEPGTDDMILIIFSPKNSAKNLAFFAQTIASFCKNFYHNIVEKKRQFFSPKIGKNNRKL
jgi:LysM repeat protein